MFSTDQDLLLNHSSIIKCKKLTFIYICVDSFFFLLLFSGVYCYTVVYFSFFIIYFDAQIVLTWPVGSVLILLLRVLGHQLIFLWELPLLSSTTPCSTFILYFSCLSPGIVYLPKDSWFLSVESSFYKISALGLFVERLWFQALSVDRACMPVWYICVLCVCECVCIENPEFMVILLIPT